MPNVSEKLYFVLNLLKYCGFYYEPFKVKSKRCKQLMKMWPIYMFRFHVACVIFTYILSYWVRELLRFDISVDFPFLLTLNTLFAMALVCLLLVYRNRKQNKKFWREITQIDDFFTRFLKIKIDYKTENRKLAEICLSYIGINFGVFVLVGFRLLFGSENYKSYKAIFMYYIMMSRVITVEYVFFVRILYNRLKILVDNYDSLKNTDSNLLVIMRVYSIIWKLTRKIEIMFKWATMAVMLVILVMALCYSHLFSLEFKKIGFKHIRVLIFNVVLNIGYVCANCSQVCSMVSKDHGQGLS